MTANRNFDDIARAWLDLMPDEAPDRVIDSVLHAVDAEPQVRVRLVASRRVSTMSRLALVAAAAVIAILAGTIALTPRSIPDVGSGPSAPASVVPSGSDGPTGGALDDVLRARWLAVANSNPTLGNGSGPVSLSISTSGTGIGATNFGTSLSYQSTVTQAGAGEIAVSLERDGGDCQAGDQGVYRWSLSGDRSQLTLNTVSEDCPKRGLVFGRRWARSLADYTLVGAGVVDTMEPDFAINLPDDTYQARTLDDFIEIAGSDGFSLMAFKNPQPFVDACSEAEERVPYRPGAEAFIEAFRANDAFEVGASVPLKIDGHDAIQVVIGGKPNYERCPGKDLYEYTPKDCLCHFIVGQGGADRMYLVEVGSDTFMFILSPFGSPEKEKPIIDSIRIPVALPLQ